MGSRERYALALAAILTFATLPGASQGPGLRILSAGPTGELRELADADQIRIIFSEPMVAFSPFSLFP